MNNIEQAKKCLQALGNAWRGDWLDFDGRTLRSQLDDIEKVLDGKMTYETFLKSNGINSETLYWEE